ncbi:uncharacterized protein [Physcomitrium patens]|uniref:uncharacterized protein n=1 Tax=Physcomitrium patens TaxID=3218 RepID=UPI003CCE4215
MGFVPKCRFRRASRPGKNLQAVCRGVCVIVALLQRSFVVLLCLQDCKEDDYQLKISQYAAVHKAMLSFCGACPKFQTKFMGAMKLQWEAGDYISWESRTRHWKEWSTQCNQAELYSAFPF